MTLHTRGVMGATLLAALLGDGSRGEPGHIVASRPVFTQNTDRMGTNSPLLLLLLLLLLLIDNNT